MKKILVAIDSFKGSLTSEEANAAVKEGLQKALPSCEVTCLPVSDGGEGVLSVLVRLSHGHYRQVEVTGPCGQKLKASYGVSGEDNNTAFIELASAAGLPQVPLSKRNPLYTTTQGVGEQLLAALESGRKHIIIGIGGSATNDAGTGLLSALGYQFLDADGHRLPGIGQSLLKIARVDTSKVSPLLKDAVFEVVCDVNNVFYGPTGAAFIFAPQKGAAPQDVQLLDKGLQAFSNVMLHATGKDVTTLPGAGAAGGVGGALAAFLNASLHPGIDFILDALHFDSLLKGSDLVITGEGHADRQSVMGKVVSGVLRKSKAQDKPVVLFCGGFEDASELNEAGITALFSLVPSPIPLSTAMQKGFATANLQRLATQVGRLLSLNER